MVKMPKEKPTKPWTVKPKLVWIQMNLNNRLLRFHMVYSRICRVLEYRCRKRDIQTWIRPNDCYEMKDIHLDSSQKRKNMMILKKKILKMKNVIKIYLTKNLLKKELTKFMEIWKQRNVAYWTVYWKQYPTICILELNVFVTRWNAKTACLSYPMDVLTSTEKLFVDPTYVVWSCKKWKNRQHLDLSDTNCLETRTKHLDICWKNKWKPWRGLAVNRE